MKKLTLMEICMWILVIGIFLPLPLSMVFGQVPVGTRTQSVLINTNNSIVFYGSNVINQVIHTNSAMFSNNVTIAAGYTQTNNGTSILSNTTVRGTLAVTQDVRFAYASAGFSTAVTNDNYSVANVSILWITNTTGTNIVFTGFSSGRDGQLLYVINNTSTNVRFMHQNALSGTTNQLDLLGIGDTNFTGRGSASFLYMSTNWMLQHISY